MAIEVVISLLMHGETQSITGITTCILPSGTLAIEMTKTVVKPAIACSVGINHMTVAVFISGQYTSCAICILYSSQRLSQGTRPYSLLARPIW